VKDPPRRNSGRQLKRRDLFFFSPIVMATGGAPLYRVIVVGCVLLFLFFTCAMVIFIDFLKVPKVPL
jgi:hypothetical protein